MSDHAARHGADKGADRTAERRADDRARGHAERGTVFPFMKKPRRGFVLRLNGVFGQEVGIRGLPFRAFGAGGNGAKAGISMRGTILP